VALSAVAIAADSTVAYAVSNLAMYLDSNTMQKMASSRARTFAPLDDPNGCLAITATAASGINNYPYLDSMTLGAALVHNDGGGND